MFSLILASYLIANAVEFTVLPVDAKQSWGVYITASTAAKPNFKNLMEGLKNKGANLVVIDVQTQGGKLAYESQLPLSIEFANTADLKIDFRKITNDLHGQGYYVIARYVVFKQWHLAHRKPEWALKNKHTKRPFQTREGLTWLDPSHPELKQYLLDVSREIAGLGFDEIQYDYVRFPEAGKRLYIGYTFTDDGKVTRDQAITNFVKESSEALHEIFVPVSIDVFGITVWNDLDWKLIGQNIPELAKYADYISPMSYPSHYSPGFLGCRNPADCPYQIVKQTMEKFLIQSMGGIAKIRPWLQGFSLRVSRFSPKYIEEQVKAARDTGLDEFLIWNASNNYWAAVGAKISN